MVRPPARITRADLGSFSTMARRLAEVVSEGHLDERTTGEGASVWPLRSKYPIRLPALRSTMTSMTTSGGGIPPEVGHGRVKVAGVMATLSKSVSPVDVTG